MDDPTNTTSTETTNPVDPPNADGEDPHVETEDGVGRGDKRPPPEDIGEETMSFKTSVGGCGP